MILADEPTGNLDSNSTKEIMDILKGLHNEGRTVILITHDNDIAAQAKRVIKIKDGKVESDSGQIVPVEELQTKYYIRFAVADRSGVLAAMAGVFAKHGVSVRSVVQRGNSEHETVNLSYVTHTAKEASVRAVLAEIAGLEDVLRAEPSVIRVEG